LIEARKAEIDSDDRKRSSTLSERACARDFISSGSGSVTFTRRAHDPAQEIERRLHAPLLDARDRRGRNTGERREVALAQPPFPPCFSADRPRV